MGGDVVGAAFPIDSRAGRRCGGVVQWKLVASGFLISSAAYLFNAVTAFLASWYFSSVVSLAVDRQGQCLPLLSRISFCPDRRNLFLAAVVPFSSPICFMAVISYNKIGHLAVAVPSA